MKRYKMVRKYTKPSLQDLLNGVNTQERGGLLVEKSTKDPFPVRVLGFSDASTVSSLTSGSNTRPDPTPRSSKSLGSAYKGHTGIMDGLMVRFEIAITSYESYPMSRHYLEEILY